LDAPLEKGMAFSARIRLLCIVFLTWVRRRASICQSGAKGAEALSCYRDVRSATIGSM
jgi:hypothetical protein